MAHTSPGVTTPDLQTRKPLGGDSVSWVRGQELLPGMWVGTEPFRHVPVPPGQKQAALERVIKWWSLRGTCLQRKQHMGAESRGLRERSCRTAEVWIWSVLGGRPPGLYICTSARRDKDKSEGSGGKKTQGARDEEPEEAGPNNPIWRERTD